VLSTPESLPPKDILEACRAANVYLYYFRDANVLGVNGDVGKVACLIIDIVRSEVQIKALMDELDLFDSLGTPRVQDDPAAEEEQRETG